MSTSINTMNNTIGKNIILDVIGSVGATSFVPTFVDAYKRGIRKRFFTLNQWKVMKEIFRDSESHWDEIFASLEDEKIVFFPESKNGEEDYNLFTIYRNHTYDHYHHGGERLVVKEN